MDIIITSAGKSERFKKEGISTPKYLIDIDGLTILEHVLNLYDYEDKFHIILNHEDYKKFKTTINSIKDKYKRISYYLIEPHNEGPVHSILSVKKLNEIKGPIIISYNDFIIDWDYNKFKLDIHGYDAAIPCFKGFHPSSFEKTLFAYIKKNSKNILTDIQEKNSFTKKPVNEPASVGMYYFKNYRIFEKFSKVLISNKSLRINNEYYVSLVFKEMLKKKIYTYISFVNKFICLGTPLDVAKFKFWLGYFKAKKKKKDYFYSQVNIIPLAGKGERFKLKKYNLPKPFIPIEENPMVITSCKSLPNSKNWIFMLHFEHLKKYPIEKKIKENFSSTLIPIKKNTSGQLTTCYLAKEFLKKDKSVFISSCDYKVIYSDKKLKKLINDEKIDGIIWTTKLKNISYDNVNNFAYCKLGKKKFITEIVEKQTISNNPLDDPMVVGCFWYRNSKDFIDSAENAFANNIKVNNEFYVGNSINYLIKQKKKRFVIFNVDYWISFGNPFELNIFHYWEDFFYNNKL